MLGIIYFNRHNTDTRTANHGIQPNKNVKMFYVITKIKVGEVRLSYALSNIGTLIGVYKLAKLPYLW